jgi:arylsulfatase A-like enzyme
MTETTNTGAGDGGLEAKGVAARVRLNPRSAFRIAVWFALLTGLGQLGVWVLAHWVLHYALHFNPQLVWMTSVANLVVFGVATLILVAAWRGRALPAAILIAVLAALATSTILLMAPRLHPVALAVLSIGFGVQTGRVLAPRLAGLQALMRRSIPAMAAIVVVLACAVNARMFWREWRGARALPAISGAMPNVLFLIWDTVRAENLSLYGYDRETTPELDRLAARSAVFDRAISPAPWTLAAHGSFFTGHMPWELSASWATPLDDAFPTIADVLTDRGYASAAFVANYIYGPPAYGLGRGFTRYRFYPLSIGAVLTSSALVQRFVPVFNHSLGTYWNPSRRHARTITDSFLDWQDGISGRPFFAFLNLFDAHDPYVPEPPFDRRFGNPRVRRVASGQEPDEAMRRDLIDAYDGAIAALDHELARVLDELQRRNVLDNTLVIVASDHGELFGEHRLYGHGNSLFFRELHVPLLISMPASVPAGVRVLSPVSLRDLPATIADLAGLANPPFPGASLARFWRTDSSHREAVAAVVPFSPRQPDWYPITAGDMRSVVDWPWHFIVKGDGSEQLFDVARDPAETNDVLALTDSATLASLRAALARVPAKVTRSGRDAS